MKLLPALATLALTAAGLFAADYPQPTGATFAHTFPYSVAGQLLFESGGDYYSGSGSVVRPKSVLTAGHNLYDYYGGWSTDILFRRGLYGSTDLSESTPTRLYILGGYRQSVNSYGADDVRAFARDMGGLLFAAPVASGASAGWNSDLRLLTGPGFKLALGYGGEFHSGDDLLSVAAKLPFYRVLGGFFENTSVYFEAGMSGGPVFTKDAAGNLYVSGIVVSGSTEPVAGGIRVIDSTAAAFIRSYLR